MSNLPPILPISPFTRPARGDVTLPGSKSLTNRALLLAALCEPPPRGLATTLVGALFSEDTHLMAEALRKLGFVVKTNEKEKSIYVEGGDGQIPNENAELFVGLAGTAARFLTAFCAAAPRGVYHIDGVPQMRKRPMRGLINALRTLGADIRCTGVEGFFPLEIHAHGLRGGTVEIDARESSQMLSALLMVAPLSKADPAIKPIGGVRLPFVEMTGKLMASFSGIGTSHWEDGAYHVPRLTEQLRYKSPGVYQIEADATAASYFLALPLVAGGTIYLPNLRTQNAWLQGDARFAEVLCETGLNIRDRKRSHPILPGEDVDEPVSDAPSIDEHLGVEATYSKGILRKGSNRDFSQFSDTFLTLAAIAPLLDGPTKISGIAHTRKQETDRVAGMARELKKIGQDVVETEDSLTITPRPLKSGVEIETYDDHRFAMSFGILGCHDLHGDGRPWLSIRNPACCAKTFPNFFELLESLRKKSLAS